MPTTPTYALPYQSLTDPPDGPSLGEDLALAVETELARIDAVDASQASTLTTLTSAWTSYVPAWTSTGVAPALGNGTITGAYKDLGQTVLVRAALTLGGTSTTGSGVYRLSLPSAPKVGSLLSAVVEDVSAGSTKWAGTALITAALATGDNMRIVVAAGTSGVGSIVPFTWASGDSLWISGLYQKN